jgi:hypothetical protein
VARKVKGWDQEDPLAIIEGVETPAQNAALRDYALMSHPRSLRRLGKHYQAENEKREKGDKSIAPPPTISQATLQRWSAKYDWVNRCMQWEMLLKIEDEEIWKDRRGTVREEDWKHGNALREIAQRIIDATPGFIKRTRKIVDEGKPQIVNLEGEILDPGRPREIVVTVALNISDLVRIEKLAMQMLRMSAEMDQSQTRVIHDWRREAESAGLDPTDVFENLVAQLVASKHGGDESTDGGGGEGSRSPDVDK